MTQAKKKSDTVVTLTIVDILLFWGFFLYNILVVKVKKGLVSEWPAVSDYTCAFLLTNVTVWSSSAFPVCF